MPGETIFQWAFEPQLHFDSDRRQASRYLASITPLTEGDVGAATRRLAQDLRQQKPRFVVLAESTMIPGYDVATLVQNEMAYRPAHQTPYTDDGKQYRFCSTDALTDTDNQERTPCGALPKSSLIAP